MRINVKLFAAYREWAGRRDLTFDVQPGTRVIDIWQALSKHHPRLQSVSPAAAINMEYTQLEAELQEGDEIAFLPPVSGGQTPFYILDFRF